MASALGGYGTDVERMWNGNDLEVGRGLEDEPYRLEERAVPKSAEERRVILQGLNGNFLFDHTTDKQKKVC